MGKLSGLDVLLAHGGSKVVPALLLAFLPARPSARHACRPLPDDTLLDAKMGKHLMKRHDFWLTGYSFPSSVSIFSVDWA